MTTELRTMLLEANPVPHNEYFDGSDELAAIFSTIQRRASMVKDDERRPDVVRIGMEPPPHRRTALVIAAAAFAVVIAIVGGIAVLTDGGPDTTVPPVTTAATTTTVGATTTTEATATTTLPPITEAEQGIIDGMIDAFNAEDIEAFVSYLSPDTSLEWATFPIAESPYSTWGNDLVNDLRRRAATDLRATQVVCARQVASILCDAVVVGALWGTVTPVDAVFQFEFEGDRVSRLRFLPNGAQLDANEDAFWRWLNETYPTEPNLVDELIVTDEVAALVEQRVADYRTFLWRSTIDPDELAVLDGLEEAFNAEDFPTFSSYFSCQTIFRSDITDTDGETNQTLCDIGGEETLERLMRFRAAKDQRLELLECAPTERATTRCEISLGGPFFGLRGGARGSLEIATTDGLLDIYDIAAYIGQEEAVERPFRDWLRANYPEEVVWVEMDTPNDQAIATFENRLPEYLASREG